MKSAWNVLKLTVLPTNTSPQVADRLAAHVMVVFNASDIYAELALRVVSFRNGDTLEMIQLSSFCTGFKTDSCLRE